MSGSMENVKEMICISCPMGCTLQVYEESGKIMVTGNTCKRGQAYGVSEYTNPVRMVTSMMRVEGQRRPLPVRLSQPVPKGAIAGVLKAIAGVCAPRSARQYDVLIQDVCHTGADVIASADVLD